MKQSTGDKFTRIGMFRIPGRSNTTNCETLISSFIFLYITAQICEKLIKKAAPHRNVSAEKNEGNQKIKQDDGKNWQNILYFTSLHLRSFRNAGTGYVWYLSRCDDEPNTTRSQFGKDKIQLETSWQRTSEQLSVSAESKSFVSILMVTKGGQGSL